MKFPIIGSVVLFSLFLIFKYLPKDLINSVLGVYFSLMGMVAMTAVLEPFCLPFLSHDIKKKKFGPFNIPIPFCQVTKF